MSLKDEIKKNGTITRYEFTPDQVKIAIAESLSVRAEDITVNYVISEVNERMSGMKDVVRIEVKHNPTDVNY